MINFDDEAADQFLSRACTAVADALGDRVDGGPLAPGDLSREVQARAQKFDGSPCATAKEVAEFLTGRSPAAASALIRAAVGDLLVYANAYRGLRFLSLGDERSAGVYSREASVQGVILRLFVDLRYRQLPRIRLSWQVRVTDREAWARQDHVTPSFNVWAYSKRGRWHFFPSARLRFPGVAGCGRKTPAPARLQTAAPANLDSSSVCPRCALDYAVRQEEEVVPTG